MTMIMPHTMSSGNSMNSRIAIAPITMMTAMTMNVSNKKNVFICLLFDAVLTRYVLYNKCI